MTIQHTDLYSLGIKSSNKGVWYTNIILPLFLYYENNYF